MLSADPSVWGCPQTGVHLSQDLHLQGEAFAKAYGNLFQELFFLRPDTFPVASCSSPTRSLMAGPTCAPLCATKSSSAVTPSLAPFAATPPIFSTSSWKATLTIRDASLSYEPTCRCVCWLVVFPMWLTTVERLCYFLLSIAPGGHCRQSADCGCHWYR